MFLILSTNIINSVAKKKSFAIRSTTVTDESSVIEALKFQKNWLCVWIAFIIIKKPWTWSVTILIYRHISTVIFPVIFKILERTFANYQWNQLHSSDCFLWFHSGIGQTQEQHWWNPPILSWPQTCRSTLWTLLLLVLLGLSVAFYMTSLRFYTDAWRCFWILRRHIDLPGIYFKYLNVFD